MALPKIDVPIYSVDLISTGKTVRFRPFSVKEEKLFLMANESDDIQAIIDSTKQVLNNCINSVKRFLNIDNMNFNQAINLSQLNFEIMKNEGVQSVIELKIKNLTIDDGDYSPIAYNVNIATQNNILYPSKDPSIFEIKYPDNDIKGLVV